MKNLKVKITIAIIVSVIVLSGIITAVTLAWLGTTVSDNFKIQLPANGMIVLKFDQGITIDPIEGSLYPAVEKVNAIANNAVFPQNLTKPHETIDSVANEMSYTAKIDVYLDNPDNPGVITPQNILFGLSLTIVTKSGEIYEMDDAREIAELFNYDLYIKIDPIPVIPEEDEGEEDEGEISEAADIITDVDEIEQLGEYTKAALSMPYLLTENKIVRLKLVVSLSQPQGLMDPELVDARVAFNLSAKTVDVNQHFED